MEAMEAMEHSEQCPIWEYKRFAWRGSDDEIEGELNRFGAEGWELVTLLYGGGGWRAMYFKRPKRAQASSSSSAK